MHDRALERAIHRLADLLRHQHRADGYQTSAQCFGEYDHVRLCAEMMRDEKRARAEHSRLHLVEYQKSSITLAQLLCGPEIIRRRYANAALRLHRLDKKCRVFPCLELVFERRRIVERNRPRIGEQWPEAFAPEWIVHHR